MLKKVQKIFALDLQVGLSF